MAQPRSVMVDNTSRYARKEAALKQQEEEIAKLEREARGETDDDSELEEQEAQSEEDGNDAPEGNTNEQPSSEEDTQSSEQEAKSEDEEDEGPEPKTAEEKTFKKRYGDLRRHLAAKEKEWQERLEKLEKAKGSNKIVPPKTDEDIEAWSKEYPDVAGIVNTIAEKKAQELFAKAEDRLKQFDEAQYEATLVKAETAIRKKHPDFDDLRNSDEFHNWAEEQPKWVQDALYENADDAQSVVRVIDLYKSDMGLTERDTKKENKSKAKDAAKSVSSSDKPRVDGDKGGKKIRESEVQKWSDKEVEERMDEVMKAMQEGNFIYDVTGGAR